ncbi:MAG: hypothetical protein WCA27_25765 [Candidatus Sulfotelmatobacter sp.]
MRATRVPDDIRDFVHIQFMQAAVVSWRFADNLIGSYTVHHVVKTLRPQ